MMILIWNILLFMFWEKMGTMIGYIVGMHLISKNYNNCGTVIMSLKSLPNIIDFTKVVVKLDKWMMLK